MEGSGQERKTCVHDERTTIAQEFVDQPGLALEVSDRDLTHRRKLLKIIEISDVTRGA